MHVNIFEPRFLVFAFAAWVALRYALWESGFRRFVVAPVALVIAVLVGLGIVQPAVAYGLVALAGVSAFLFNQLQEEHARRRRVASLVPRAATEIVPAVWILSAAASALLLTPYVVLGEQRAAALMVGICALAMAAIAWRIASAPAQLAGGDIRSERMRDRAMRSRRTGLTAIVAVGSVFVFLSLVNSELPVVTPLQRLFDFTSLIVSVALLAWVAWYVHHLDRLSCSAYS